MSARDELVDEIAGHPIGSGYYSTSVGMDEAREIADVILAAGYRKPREIQSFVELENLPYGSAVQTSDASDVVVLRCEGNDFRNQSGCNLSATDLWRYGTRPFTVIYEPEPTP